MGGIWYRTSSVEWSGKTPTQIKRHIEMSPTEKF